MQTPSELQALAFLRRRGQCPQMPVFVTDCWPWATKLEALGCLVIRVRRPGDFDHDWAPLGGLHVILLQRDGNYAALGQCLLAAQPAIFETFTLNQGGRTVCGNAPLYPEKERRDYLIVKHLIAAEVA